MSEQYTRRGFIELSGMAGMAALSGGTFEQVDTVQIEADGFEHHGLLIGPANARPAVDGSFLGQWDTYQFAYFATDTGEKWYTTHLDGSWNSMATEFTGPETQVDEVRVEDFASFFNHTFARPNAPDDKNWNYTPADVTKDGSEIELASTTKLVSHQRGNYPPGGEAVPGVAFRLTGDPTGGECFAGYFVDSDDDNVPDDGFGFGMDTTGTFTFIAKDGTLRRVYQDNWNGPDSVDTDPFRLHYPRICRFPHLFYGGGSIAYRIVDHDDTPESVLRTVHIETPETASEAGAPFNAGPPFSQPNLPIAFVTNGLAGGSLRANAAHYEVGQDQGETRVNGEHFINVTVGTSGWTPLISWQKRTGWEMVNVKPLRIGCFAETNDVKLELQLNTTLDANASFGLPTHTDGDETAVQVDTAGGINSNGQRRWAGFAPAGQGSQPGDLEAEDLEFNLPSELVVTLASQAVGGEATVSGTINWQEYF